MPLVGKTGLAPHPSTAKQLHQPHQAGFTDPGDLYTRAYRFPSPSFGAINEIYLETLPMVIEDAWIEAIVTKNASYFELPPMEYWISPVGVVLRNEGKEVYRMTESEAARYHVANLDWVQQQKWSNATHQGAKGTIMPGNTADVYTMRLSLRPIVEKLMSNFGPLDAYPSRKWSLAFGMKLISQIYEQLQESTPGTPDFTLNSLTLFLSGHREDSQNSKLVSYYLAEAGVMTTLDYPYEVSKVLATTSGGDITFDFTSVEGDCTGIWLMLRDNTVRTATDHTKDVRDWISQSLITDGADAQLVTVSVGTDGAPNDWYGQPFTIGQMGNMFSTNSKVGAPIFPYAATIQQSGLIVLPTAEKFSMGQKYGTYTGSRFIKNNLRVVLTASGTLTQPYYVTCIVFVRRSVVITHGGVQVVNTYASA